MQNANETPEIQRDSKKVETSITVHGRSEHDLTMIGAWTHQSEARPFADHIVRALETHFLRKIMTFCAPAKSIHIQNHRIVRLPRKVTSQDYQVVCMFPFPLSILFSSLFCTLLFFFPSLFSTKFVNVYLSLFFFLFLCICFSLLFFSFLLFYCSFLYFCFSFSLLVLSITFLYRSSLLICFPWFFIFSFLLFFPKLGKRDQTSFDNTDCVDPNLAPWK